MARHRPTPERLASAYKAMNIRDDDSKDEPGPSHDLVVIDTAGASRLAIARELLRAWHPPFPQLVMDAIPDDHNPKPDSTTALGLP